MPETTPTTPASATPMAPARTDPRTGMRSVLIGVFVNAALVRDGYAEPLTIPPNVAHAGELASLARAARHAGRGLWNACSR